MVVGSSRWRDVHETYIETHRLQWEVALSEAISETMKDCLPDPLRAIGERLIAAADAAATARGAAARTVHEVAAIQIQAVQRGRAVRKRMAAAAAVAAPLPAPPSGCSTVELFSAAFRVAEPLLRKTIVQALVYRQWNPLLGLRKDEVTVNRYDPSTHGELLEPFVVRPRAIQLLTGADIEASKKEWKNFTWPDGLDELYQSNEFLAADLLDLEIVLEFAPGVELFFGNDKAAIELGSDKDSLVTSKSAQVRIVAPQLRAWWDSRTMELSLAFMRTPEVELSLHANIDTFGFDMGGDVTERGWVDDFVEYVLSGFGPMAARKPFPGLLRTLFDWSQQKFFAEFGNGRPFVLDLSGRIREDTCMRCLGSAVVACPNCDGTGVDRNSQRGKKTN